MLENNPLVSIIVITYNSAKFVLETLESAKAQTYQNIELIISDDGSTDSTIQICKDWLAQNKDRFVRTELITVEKNTGIPANCNRGVRAAQGEWVKLIAGDDILLENCVEDNVCYIQENKDVRVLFSKLKLYNETFDNENFLKTIPSRRPEPFMSDQISASNQYKMLLVSDRISFTPSNFFSRQIILDNNGFDESLRFIEDYPMWLKLTRVGVALYFMDSCTCCYRTHSEAIHNKGKKLLIDVTYFKTENFRKAVTYPNLPYDIRLMQQFHWQISKIFNNSVSSPKNSTF